MSKNKSNWQPSAPIDHLRIRAAILARIRNFFAERQVLEVDTPLLAKGTVTDPHVQGISVAAENRFLQTSPEYAMKRLLAAGSGSIYQICKAFRQGDVGKFHNPEFTMLEWYRVGYDHHALMNEVGELLQCILKTKQAVRMTYQDVFESHLEIDPHTVSTQTLAVFAREKASLMMTDIDRQTSLDLLFTHCIEAQLGQECPVFIYDFPLSHAALAKIRQTELPPVASRFEVYYRGVELANGFHELQDDVEQAQRFAADLHVRTQLGIPSVTIDEKFLAALKHGLPDCAGVALGVDRLVMLALGCSSIAEVMSFTYD